MSSGVDIAIVVLSQRIICVLEFDQSYSCRASEMIIDALDF